MKSIKIFTKCQLILLRNVNPLLGRYRLPQGVLKRIDHILEEEVLGEQGFLVVLLNPVRDDVREIEDAVNVYPLKVEFINELERGDIQNHDCGMVKGKEWFLNKLCIQGTDSYVYVLYFIMQKHLYKNIQ